MSVSIPDQAGRQSTVFLGLYALAWAGCAIAYTPFLTLLLPSRVAMLAGPDAIAWLARLTFIGAAAASCANIAFGWLSDVSGARRPWIVAGLIAASVLLPLFGRVSTFSELAMLLVAWQCSINAMIAPLAAWAGDCVPDRQKGTLGGLLAVAPAAGALAGVVATLARSQGIGLIVVAGLVIACIAPLVMLGRPRKIAPIAGVQEGDVEALGDRPVALRMWLARLMVQVSEAALFAFFMLWLRQLTGRVDDLATARLMGAVLIGGVPLALMIGPLADRIGRPMLPLRVGALVAGTGLAAMALANVPAIGIAGYVLFGLSTNVFLALHSAQTLRALPRADRRGRDLGLFNLTNTVPSLVMPWLTLALVPELGFRALFLVLAMLAFAASPLLASTRRRP